MILKMYGRREKGGGEYEFRNIQWREVVLDFY